jgi:hypothetical protein
MDGGVTFSQPRAATPVFINSHFDSAYRVPPFYALAVSPANGDVYVAYFDHPNDKVGAQVEFVRSADGGATFSAPVSLNDHRAGHQFFPAITVDTDGVLHACWFDTRNAKGGANDFDVYATYSRDRGATWARNARVTPSLISADTSFSVGDYTGIAAADGYAHPVWPSRGIEWTGVALIGGVLQTATLELPPEKEKGGNR